ncbi:MAG: 50S ribosomal protein L22 [Clostridia bacterium]|nr:50S ribosomal protein L22 [Clostridia bacterium]
MSRGIKERTERKKANRDKRPYAIARYIRIPNSKVKFVLDLIRGKGYEDAVNILKNLNKSASPVVLKVLNSAAANAENNLAMSKDNLFVAECYATNAPQMKRMMPRARGRADRILKRSCHIAIRLDEVKVGQKDVNKAAGKTVAQKAATTTTKAATATKTTATETTTAKTTTKTATAKTTGTKTAAKAIPSTAAEKPVADKPNAVKPLGTKAVSTKTTAAKKATTSATKTAAAKKEAK